MFPLVQKYKNRPRNAGVMIENKVVHFCGPRSTSVIRMPNYVVYNSKTAHKRFVIVIYFKAVVTDVT